MMLSLVWDQRVRTLNCVICISISISVFLFFLFFFILVFFPFIFDILLNKTFAEGLYSIYMHTVFWLCWFRFSAIFIGWRRIQSILLLLLFYYIVHVNSSEQNQVEYRIVVRLFVCCLFFLFLYSRDAIFSYGLLFWWSKFFFCSFASRFRSGFIKIMIVTRFFLALCERNNIEKITIVDLQWFVAHDVVCAFAFVCVCVQFNWLDPPSRHAG